MITFFCVVFNSIILPKLRPRIYDEESWIIGKEVIAIDPDAHDKDKYTDMKYGVFVGRKAGLTKEMTLNTMSLVEIESWLGSREK